MNSQKTVMTTKEAARYINMSESWLRIARMKGGDNTPPFIKMGRSVRYLKEDLDQWMQERRKRNTLLEKLWG